MEKTADTKSKAGRKPKYTAKALEKQIEKYFESISFLSPVRDPFGNVIKDDNGDVYSKRIYHTPPMISGLCLFLGIDRSTWENYSSSEEHPEMHDVTERTKMRMENYLEEALITRTKGSVRGIMFNLQNNYGWREKKEVELGSDTRKVVSESASLSLAEKLSLINDALTGELIMPDEDNELEDEND